MAHERESLPATTEDGDGPVIGDADPPVAFGGGCHSDPEAKVALRRLPHLMREGFRLVWAAGRRDFQLVLGLQVVSGVVVTVVLVVGRRGLDVVLGAIDRRGSLASVAPWAVLLAALVAVNLAVSALQRERSRSWP